MGQAKRKTEQRGGTKLGSLHRRSLWRRWRKWIIAAAVVLMAGGGIGAWQWSVARTPLEPAPRFNLMASTGKVVTLDAFLGKQEVVLIFYMGAG